MPQQAYLQAELDHLRATRAELETEAKMLLEENVKVTQQLGQLRAEVDHLRASQADPHAKQQLAQLQAEVDLLRSNRAELAAAHAALEAEHGRLVMSVRMQGERAAGESGGKEAENAVLREQVHTLRAERGVARVQIEEMQRLCEQHAYERGTLEAEASRLRAENNVLAEESRDLLLRLQEAELHHGGAAEVAGAEEEPSSAAALASAEQWVLHHAARPSDEPRITYPGGACIDFAALASKLMDIVIASVSARAEVERALESGDAARGALQAFRVHDTERRGHLEWRGRKIQDFVEAVFHRHGLLAPSEGQVREVFRTFDREGASRLDARRCVCLADALLRGVCILRDVPRTSSASTAVAPVAIVTTSERGGSPSSTSPQADLVSPAVSAVISVPFNGSPPRERGSPVPHDFEACIQRRLEACERAAEDVVSRLAVRPAAAL